MKKSIYLWLALLFIFPLTLDAKEQFVTTPVPHHGKPWRIGYYESGAYYNYDQLLREVVASLADMGWFKTGPLPPSSKDNATDGLWRFLASRIQSDYIEFVESAYWTSGFDAARRHQNQAAVARRFQQKDLDLIIAMGTWAGQDLATDNHDVPTVVMSTSDPIRAGIIKSAEDSGRDHVYAKCDPTRVIRQLRLFHDIFNFKRLGVAYENNENGRIYSNLAGIEQVAREREFKVITCFAPDDGYTAAQANGFMTACYQSLAPRIDAFFISDHRGDEPRFLPKILAPMFAHNIPTWAKNGRAYVKRGALMCVAREGMKDLGGLNARVIASIFNGIKPRDLDQTYREPFKLAVNLETARRIGYKLPPNILKIANFIYDQIDAGALTDLE